MKVQAEVSLYPLKTMSLGQPIEQFVEQLRHADLEIECGTMSTMVAGDAARVFSALGGAFEDTATNREIVLVLKVSNACPSCASPDSHAAV